MGASPKMSQAMQFVIQGANQVTVAQGQTPVIAFDFTGLPENAVFPVASAVNFLRSGCPSVQLTGAGTDVNWGKAKQDIKDQFAALQLSHELFHGDADDKRHILLYKSDRSTHD